MIFILTTVLYLTKHGNLQASLMFWYLLFCSKQSKQRFYSKYSWYWRSDRAWTKAQVNSSVILFALRVWTKSLKSDMTCSSHKINWVPSVSNHSLVPHLDNRTSEKTLPWVLWVFTYGDMSFNIEYLNTSPFQNSVTLP